MKPLRTVFVAAALAVLSAGCTKPREHVRSVEEFMEEPAILHGVVLNCNSHRDHAMHETECINAWAAVERLGQADDVRQDQKHEKEFEKSREKVRLVREQQAAATREAPYDPYRAPVASDPPAAENH